MAEAELAVLSTIEQIAPAEWNALSGGRAFLDHRWLQFVERVVLNYRPRYVVLRSADHLEAAAVCSVEHRFANPTLQQRAGWVLRRLPCVRCSVPIASECGLIFRPGADEARLAPTLLDGVRRLAARERALFTTVRHLPRGSNTWQSLQRAGGAELSRWSNTSLSIEWSSFDDYVANRPGPDRRELARMRRRAEREGITIERPPIATLDLPLLWQLIENVQQRHAATESYVPDLLQRAASVLDGDLHLLVAHQSGQTIGCAALVRSENELLGKWLGLDYARTWNSAAYYMLLAESVALAIALGVRRLRLGASAYTTKQQFGVVPDERVNALLLPAPLRLLANLGRAA
jgi:predicted N-acyltransferase